MPIRNLIFYALFVCEFISIIKKNWESFTFSLSLQYFEESQWLNTVVLDGSLGNFLGIFHLPFLILNSRILTAILWSHFHGIYKSSNPPKHKLKPMIARWVHDEQSPQIETLTEVLKYNTRIKSSNQAIKSSPWLQRMKKSHKAYVLWRLITLKLA